MSKLILTVACPEASRDDASHMAVAYGWLQGEPPASWQSAFGPQYQDADGNLYRVFSHASVSQETIDGLQHLLSFADLQRPPQDVPDEDGKYTLNMAAANRGHDMLRGNVWLPAQPDPETGEMPDNPVPQVSPDKLVAVVGLKGREAIAAMGLSPIPVDMP
jgi:hypothetical protein